LTRITAAITRRFIVHRAVKLKRSLRDNESGDTATPEAAAEEEAAAVEAAAVEAAAVEAAAVEVAEEEVVVAARVAPSAASYWRHSAWKC
jgi:hypothetical protein